jgi:hypothetical protein
MNSDVRASYFMALEREWYEVRRHRDALQEIMDTNAAVMVSLDHS